jgi:hypothetical protein
MTQQLYSLMIGSPITYLGDSEQQQQQQGAKDGGSPAAAAAAAAAAVSHWWDADAPAADVTSDEAAAAAAALASLTAQAPPAKRSKVQQQQQHSNVAVTEPAPPPTATGTAPKQQPAKRNRVEQQQHSNTAMQKLAPPPTAVGTACSSRASDKVLKRSPTAVAAPAAASPKARRSSAAAAAAAAAAAGTDGIMLPAAKLSLKRSMQRTTHTAAAAAAGGCVDRFAKTVWHAAGVKRTRHTGAEKEAGCTDKTEATAAAAVLEPDARAAVSVKREATEEQQKQAAGYRLPQVAGAAAAGNMQSRAPPAAAAANVSAADINKASSSCCTAAGAAVFGAAAGPSAARLDCTPVVYGDPVTAASDCGSVNLLWPADFQQQQQLVGTDSTTNGRGVFQMLPQQARDLQLVTRILQPKLQQQQQQQWRAPQQQQQQVLHLEWSELLDENAAGSCLRSNSSSNSSSSSSSTGFPSSRCVSVDAPAACSITTAAAAAAGTLERSAAQSCQLDWMRAADRNTFGTSIFEGSRSSAGAGGFCGAGSLLKHAAAETATAVNASCTASAWPNESKFDAAFAALPITTAAAAAEVQVKMGVDAPNSSTSCSDVKMYELDGNG